MIMASIMIVAVAAVEGASPLIAGAAELVSVPLEVRYEFVCQAFPNFRQPRGSFALMPQVDQNEFVLRGYYVQSLRRALLLHRGDAALVAILNGMAEPGADPQAIALQFEDEYRRKFGKWPNLVPVDVEALTDRMLRQREIR